MGPGGPAGGFLARPEWLLVEEAPGRLVVDVPLVPAVKNFRGHLFGGFAPTYIDLIALRTVSAGQRDRAHGWLLTLNMHIEYFEPVEGPRFLIESVIGNRRGKTVFVETRFKSSEGK